MTVPEPLLVPMVHTYPCGFGPGLSAPQQTLYMLPTLLQSTFHAVQPMRILATCGCCWYEPLRVLFCPFLPLVGLFFVTVHTLFLPIHPLLKSDQLLCFLAYPSLLLVKPLLMLVSLLPLLIPPLCLLPKLLL